MRRRPLLAPLLIPLLVVLAAGAGVSWIGTWARTTVVILVRHAESTTAMSGDPDLSPQGEARAALLGEFVADLLTGEKVRITCMRPTRVARSRPRPRSGTSSGYRSI